MTAPSTPTLPAEVAAQLAQLRDIHLPDPISWWPLAPGWWALAAFLLICSACVLIVELRRRRSLKYKALRELDELRSGTAAHVSIVELASELCVLVRRVVLNTANGRLHVNTHGDAWSGYLAASPNGMPDEIARFIATAPYALHAVADQQGDGTAPDSEALLRAVENWIRRHA